MGWKIFSKKQGVASKGDKASEDKKVPKTIAKEELKKNQSKESGAPEKSVDKGTKQKVSFALREWEIIKYPYLSEKSTRLRENNQYVFAVHQKANKIQIKKAIEVLYKVKVKKVNIVRRPATIRKYRNLKSAVEKEKKAIVTLAEGQKIEF